MSRVTKGVLWGVAILIVTGLGFFGWDIYVHYRAIREGTIPPSIERRLEASFTRVIANTQVTAADLRHLASAQADLFGAKTSKLTITEFIDFDCPYSRASFPAVRGLMEKYKDRAAFVLRDFPIEELHPRAPSAALAARCAQAQGKFWAYHDKLFLDSEHHEDADLFRSARAIGLNETEFKRCYQEKKYATQVQQDVEDGLQVGVQGTPTFFFNGVKVQGALDEQTLEFLIKQFLK